MNLLRRISLAAFAAVSALVFAGCQAKSTNSGAPGEKDMLGPQFSAKKGLLLPEETRQSLGVKVVEVAERSAAATVEIQLRVYEATKATSRASGTVTPEQAKQLRPGEGVQIRTSGGKIVAGKITALNDQLLKATGMIEVLAEIPNTSGEFAAGTFLQASLELAAQESVATIPRAALLECSDGYSVYTVSGEHLMRTPVKVGVINAEYVEIKDGLYAGDQVVVQAVMALWLTELAAVKGGQACCVAPPKGK